MKEQGALFHGSQNDMCDSIWQGWENCAANIKDFQKTDSKYTPAFIAGKTKAILEAKKIPGIAPRRSSQTTVKDALSSEGNTNIANWLVIFGFIEKIFPGAEQDSLKMSAGYAGYPAAAAGSWSSLFTMLQDGSDFLAGHGEELLAGGMQPDFPDQYAAGQTRYNDLYYQYISARQGVSVKTTNKLDALNAVYKDFTLMSRDAKRTYRKDPAKKELFTYTKLLQKVAGARKGGFHITLRTEAAKLPVTTSTIVFNPGSKPFYANEKGIIVADLKEGAYSYTLTTPDYRTLTGTLVATTGVQHRVELFLQPAAEAASA